MKLSHLSDVCGQTLLARICEECISKATMKDTSPEIEQKVHEMMMARSRAERMIMGSLMFEAARAIVIASLPKDLSEDEIMQ